MTRGPDKHQKRRIYPWLFPAGLSTREWPKLKFIPAFFSRLTMTILMLLPMLLTGMTLISSEVVFFCGDLARVNYKTGRNCWVKCQRGDLGPWRLKQLGKQTILVLVCVDLKMEMTGSEKKALPYFLHQVWQWRSPMPAKAKFASRKGVQGKLKVFLVLMSNILSPEKNGKAFLWIPTKPRFHQRSLQ